MEVDSNPFRAPVAQVYDYSQTSLGTFLPDGRRVPAGRGYQWLQRGWGMFRTAPGTWVGIAVAFITAVMILGMIPFLSVGVNLLIPVFIGGISIGCRAIEEGQGIRFAHLFAGFSRRPGALLLVGLLYLIGLLLVAIVVGIVVAISGAVVIGVGGPESPGDATPWSLVVFILAMILVFAPLAMAVWLAPPLVVLHELSAYQALRSSLLVALRNFSPFLVYGLMVLLAAILASLPLMIGWLLLLPVLYASLYAAYRDLFFSE